MTNSTDLNKSLDSQIEEIIMESAILGVDSGQAYFRDLDEAVNRILKLIQTVGEGLLPEKKNIVVLTEPPQGIDRLWLEGRDYGATAGYNQAINDMKTNLTDITGVDRDE